MGWRVVAPQQVHLEVTAETVDPILTRLTDATTREVWIESEDGRKIAFVTNGQRALVVLMVGPGDPGEHLISPDAGEGECGGFVLDNGQVDSYPASDTVPVKIAMAAIASQLESGHWPDSTNVAIDR